MQTTALVLSCSVSLLIRFHKPLSDLQVFEGKGKAVLYTGDIRSEPWHVNALARSPYMIDYSSGSKTLDNVYLDTSFTEDVNFQTKAEGLRELIDKVSQYPKDTIFHFSAWTYGYEDVWIALARALNTRVRTLYLSRSDRAADSFASTRFMLMTTSSICIKLFRSSWTKTNTFI